MNHATPAGKGDRFVGAGQRLSALLVFVVIAAMFWAARSGRYDREVNQLAHWMKTHWEALVH